MNGIRFSRYLTLSSYLALIGLLVMWYGVLSPSPVVLSLLLLPLVFPLRGLFQGHPYTFAWSSFLILIYFIHGVVEAFANPTVRLLASFEILCSVGFYVGAILYARWRGRQLKQDSC
jgi:uncharacterized membrane protein